MSGNKYVLDTNAIIALLQGNELILKELEAASEISISVVSYIEFLSFPSITLNDQSIFKKFVEQISVTGLPGDDYFYLDSIATYKALSGLNLPDVIIAASALSKGAFLITNDKDFLKMKGLQIITF